MTVVELKRHLLEVVVSGYQSLKRVPLSVGLDFLVLNGVAECLSIILL